MTASQSFSLTAEQRRRIEHIDELVVLGAAGVSELVDTMSDPSWTVRRATVAALAAAGDDAVAPLCRWIAEVRSSERAVAAAVDALAASIGGSANTALVALLAHPTPAVVTDAAQILGRRRVVAAAPAIEPLLAHDDDNVALAAVDALGLIGASSSVAPLVGVLARGNFFRTFGVLQVLPKLDDPRIVAPIAALLDSDVYLTEAIAALGRTGSVLAVAPLAGLLDRAAGDALIRPLARAFADLLAHATYRGAGEAVVAEMRKGLRGGLDRFVAALRVADPAERAAIATVLGRIGDTHALPALARLLDDPALVEIATDAIERIGQGTDAVLPLLDDDAPEVRTRACAALARIGDTSVVGALFERLADPSPQVAHAAAAALQSLGSAETSRRALDALVTAAPSVRRQALRIVAYLAPAGAFEPVLAAVGDPDPRIAELAIAALGALDDPRVGPALDELAGSPIEVVRAAAMRATGQRGGAGAIARLERGLADGAAWVRYYACQGLGRLAHAPAAPLLIARLADPAPHVRIAAVEALAHLDTPAAWDAVCKIAGSREPDERRAALVGIGLRARPAALPFLLAAAADADEATRLIAYSGLARRAEPAAIAVLAEAARSGTAELAEAALSLLAESDAPDAAEAILALALASPPEHAVQLALSRPSASRIAAIAKRLATADERDTGALVAALARMGGDAATAALGAAAGSSNPHARRLAAAALDTRAITAT